MPTGRRILLVAATVLSSTVWNPLPNGNNNRKAVSAFTTPSIIKINKNQITTRRSILQSIAADDTITSTSSSSSPEGDFSFFDEASINVRAGSGGQGSSTYQKAKKAADGAPDGGSGGPGGNIVLVIDGSLNTLAGLSPQTLRPNSYGGGGAAASSKRTAGSSRRNANLYSFRAQDGRDGGRMHDNGRAGEDFEVRVPPGTVISIEHLNGEEYDLEELGSVTCEDPSLIVAKGGRGGEGTSTLKLKKKGGTRRGPGGGERYRLRLTLKIVADIALVGVPNAGKSTFLASVTRAKPRIADYPFTTVIPNLGTWIPPTDNNNKQHTNAGSAGLVLCDVPGLIEGASEGVGLGHAFLRHIERCRVILHLVDVTAANPIQDYTMINDELRRYGTGTLSLKPQVVVMNKMDLAKLDEEHKSNLKEELKKVMGHTRLMWISAKEREGVDDLMTRMASYLATIKEEIDSAAVVR